VRLPAGNALRRTLAVPALFAIAAGGGCVAIPVGAPETFSKEVPGAVRDAGDPRVVSRQPRERVIGRETAGRRIAWIGLEGEIVSEQPREQTWRRIGIVKQRRMAFGVMPGMAEKFLDGDFSPDEGDWRETSASNYGMGIALGCYAATPWKLLVEPFWGSWECKHHGWTEHAARNGDGVLKHFTSRERQSMGLEPADENDFLAGFSHAGVVGFHRHCKYTVMPPAESGKRTPAAPATLRRVRQVQGPYRVALELPACGFAQTLEVPRGATGVDFNLEEVRAAGDVARGVIRFLPPAGGVEELRNADDRALLAAAGERSFPADIRVKAEAPPRWTAPPAPDGPQTVVKEYHHYHETKVVEARVPETAPWEIETVAAYRSGRAEYRVSIRDAAKKAFEVEREVKPEIERLLRDAFLAAQPGMDAKAVRTYALPEFAGRTIRFKGVAFSVQPLTDGWRYDADTGRGSVRLRISEGMSPDEAKRWARENIEAIVKEKNVALEAGKAPPEGAVYRSLGETLEDGVLTVEFEALE